MSCLLNLEITQEGVLMELKLKYNLEEKCLGDINNEDEKNNILTGMINNFENKSDINEKILILLEMRNMIEYSKFYSNDEKKNLMNNIKNDPEFNHNKILNYEYLQSEVIFLRKTRQDKIIMHKFPSLRLLEDIDKNSIGHLNYRNEDYHIKPSIEISFYPEIQTSRRMSQDTVMIVGNSLLRDKFESNDRAWFIGLDLNKGLSIAEIKFEYDDGWYVSLLDGAYNSIKIKRKGEPNSLRIFKNDLWKRLKLKKYDEVHIGLKSLFNKKERYHKLLVSHLLNEDLKEDLNVDLKNDDEISVLTSEE